MESRDKKILIGVGVSLVVSVGMYFYNGYRETELVSNAKYQAVSGGLADSRKKMGENDSQVRAEVKEAAAANDAAKVKEAKAAPVESRAIASVLPAAALPPAAISPVVASIQNDSSLDKKKNDASLRLALPNVPNLPPAVALARALPSTPDLKMNEIAFSESSLYLRYKGLLFRVSLRKGIQLGSPQLNGFSGQRVETIVSDDTQADCKTNCYQLSEKLIGQLKDAKSARTFLKTQAWFLVDDQVNGTCESVSSKKLLITQDIEAKCVIGMVTEGKTLHMTAHDTHATLDASSVIIMQRVASRAPASEN